MLDAIRGQALEDGSEASSDMIEALSTMMRYVISNRDSMVTLGTEIKSVDNYIKIQQYRFGDRLIYHKNLDELDQGLIETKIPKMTFQPIIENAISHGVEPLFEGGEIRLRVFNTQSRIVIQITDNGQGMYPESLIALRRRLMTGEVVKAAPPEGTGSRDGAGSKDGKGSNEGKGSKGTGIALQNVNARLKLAFGSRYGLNVSSVAGMGTGVEINLPINLPLNANMTASSSHNF